VLGGVGGGWLISQLGFAAVFWAATACAGLAWLCARRLESLPAADAGAAPGGAAAAAAPAATSTPGD
jgi:hypothetical protein